MAKKKSGQQYQDLKGFLSEARNLMEQGSYVEAMEILEGLYSDLQFYGYETDPELDRIRAATRKLAGELRSRMMTRSLGMGASKRQLEMIRRHLDRVRDLSEEGQNELAMELLNTVWQVLWYWEDTRDPELGSLTDEARRLAARLRMRLPAAASGYSMGGFQTADQFEEASWKALYGLRLFER